jgi:hypothetical protein
LSSGIIIDSTDWATGALLAGEAEPMVLGFVARVGDLVPKLSLGIPASTLDDLTVDDF